MPLRGVWKVVQALLVLALISVSFLYLLRPIVDNDFFWHLKTGEWIWQNRALPAGDPFSYSAPPVHSGREEFILTSYWLSQVTLYLSYLAGGLGGIVVSRFILVSIFVFILLRWRGVGDDVPLALALLLLFMSIFLMYPVERPQFFSFLCFALLLRLLGRIRGGTEPARMKGLLVSVPLVMIIWANMHGGHIVGQATILLFVILEGIRFLHPSLEPLSGKTYIALAAAGAAGIAFSLINPNTYHAVGQLLNTDRMLSDMISNNVEYMSSVERYSIGGGEMLLFWLFCVLCMAGALLTIRRPDITWITLLAATGYFAFTSIRYIPFFMIAALPFIGKALSREGILKYARVLLVVMSLCVAVYFGGSQRHNISRVSSGNMISGFAMPVKAADFILRNDLKGNMFNFSDWGGYLMWRLGPERKVFIDGRFLYPETYFIERSVGSAAAFDYNGSPYWKSVLDYYHVNYIVLPLFSQYGETYPLLFELIKDNAWVPVFYSLKTLVFVRNSQENYRVIMYNAVPKPLFIDRLIEGCDSLIKIRPGDFQFYMAKSDLNMFRGDFMAARAGYQKVLELAPDYDLPRQKLKLIDLNTAR